MEEKTSIGTSMFGILSIILIGQNLTKKKKIHLLLLSGLIPRPEKKKKMLNIKRAKNVMIATMLKAETLC